MLEAVSENLLKKVPQHNSDRPATPSTASLIQRIQEQAGQIAELAQIASSLPDQKHFAHRPTQQPLQTASVHPLPIFSRIDTDASALSPTTAPTDTASTISVPTASLYTATLNQIKGRRIHTESVYECVFFVVYGQESGTVGIGHLYRDDKDIYSEINQQPFKLEPISSVLKPNEKVSVIALGGNINDLVMPTKKDFAAKNGRFMMDNIELDYPAYRKHRQMTAHAVEGVGMAVSVDYEALQSQLLGDHLTKEVSAEEAEQLIDQAHLLPPQAPDQDYFHSVEGEWKLSLKNFCGNRNLRILRKQFPDADFKHFYTRLGCNISVLWNGENFCFTVEDPETLEQESLTIRQNQPVVQATLKRSIEENTLTNAKRLQLDIEQS